MFDRLLNTPLKKYCIYKLQIMSTYLAIGPIEDIKRAIVFLRFQILFIVFEFHANRMTIIIFTNFKFLVPVFFRKALIQKGLARNRGVGRTLSNI